MSQQKQKGSALEALHVQSFFLSMHFKKNQFFLNLLKIKSWIKFAIFVIQPDLSTFENRFVALVYLCQYISCI